MTDHPARPLLQVNGLRTVFPGHHGVLTLVNDVSLSVDAGETLAVVGESGSGKTMTFLSVLGLVPRPGKIAAGKVHFDGRDLTTLAAAEWRRLRGAQIAMVFQDPLTALNPVFTVGKQLIEVIRAHRSIGKAAARRLAVEMLERVHIPDPRRRLDDYPHQLSGGMRQRVLVAMAISLGPKLLIADEPTTALDVTVQAQILELLAEIRRDLGMGLVLITHDLGLVATYADRVAVMYAGRVVEYCAVEAGFDRPKHPYTQALLRSIPRLDLAPELHLAAIQGQPPTAAELFPGCAFEPRCPLGAGRTQCRERPPPLASTDDRSHLSACVYWDQVNSPELATP